VSQQGQKEGKLKGLKRKNVKTKPMETKEILENNKLIAEFTGAKEQEFIDGSIGLSFWNPNGSGRLGKYPDGSTSKYDDELKYHFSWDWLMPVVEKIEKFRFKDEIDTTDAIQNYAFLRTLQRNQARINRFSLFTGDTKIDAVWKAVVEFIKWYNRQEK
jgi:hypothetical protein